MIAPTYDWEQPLLAMAYEGRHSISTADSSTYDHGLMALAYARCEEITAINSRSFSLASRLLPAPKRRAARALYAFCRTTDDIVDQPAGDTSEALCDWWGKALSGQPPRDDLVAVAWTDTSVRYQIPRQYAQQLIYGVERDLHQTRYATFEDLAEYCYGVASTVGLMSMHIIGFESDEAIKYAVKLGVALQLTNILRDVAEDWQNGRLYLPQEDLDAFGLAESDIDGGIVDDRWRNFMRFQIARTRQLYEEAWPGIALLAPEGRFAIAAAAEFYRGILEDIETHDYDVFSRRTHVTKWGKLRRLPRLWWETRRLKHEAQAMPRATSRQRWLPTSANDSLK
jgi:phytoene synthase